MASFDPPYTYTVPDKGYFLPPKPFVGSPNYCPTCGKPWFGGWYWPHQPEFVCKTDDKLS